MSKTDLETRMKRHRKKRKERDADLPEEIVINILARLPLQSIIRFKLVCREWKSVMESAFFNNLYQSNSNRYWTILHGNYRWTESCLEEVKLDLPHESSSHGSCYDFSSFVSGFTQNKKNKIKEIKVVACTDGLVLLHLKEEDMKLRYYIGNPVLPHWIQLPLPPPPRETLTFHNFNDSGLVTRMQNGAILSYKVVRINGKATTLGYSREWSFEIFSSDTGEWSVKQVTCPGHGVSMLNTSNPVSLNGKLHWLDQYSRRIIVHDFFSSHDDDDQVLRAISLPARMQDTQWDRYERRCRMDSCGSSPCGKMIFTTSQGCFVFIDVGLIEEDEDRVESYNVRVWRLKSTDDSFKWEKAWEINMACLGLGFMCVPMAINCFDIHIIYLWDLDRRCFLACNLRTLTKSYGTRKDGADRKSFFASILSKCRETRKDGAVVYKEDIFSFEPRSCILQFVPSLQVLPT